MIPESLSEWCVFCGATGDCLSPSSFFLEKNMQQFFLKILSQKCGRYVCLQLLQTLSILFENIRNETSICELLPIVWTAIHVTCCIVYTDYLLSNNHVNSLIVLKLDFSDEEVLAYYISFLKTLSFKLNTHTIHFFYNEVKAFILVSCIIIYCTFTL